MPTNKRRDELRKPGLFSGMRGQSQSMSADVPAEAQNAPFQPPVQPGMGISPPEAGMPQRGLFGGLPLGARVRQLMGMDDGREAAAGLDAPNAPVPEGMMYRTKITKEVLNEAMLTLRKYKAGKASVERRIIEAQQWWKLRNWEQIERTKGVQGSHDSKSNTAWLWNCIVGKHADAMDSYPEPVVRPRMQDDKAEAQRLSEIVPVIMTINGFEQTYSDVAWQKMLEGTGAYGVYWDKDKSNGVGDVSIRKVNLLNLFWEPGVSDIQDSTNIFHVALMDNRQLVQLYPQLRGQKLGGDKFVTEYRYDDNVDTTNKSLVVDWYYHGYEGGRKILHYCKFTGEHVLYCTEDDPEAQNGLYDDGLFPFVLDPLFPVEGSPAGFGYIHVGKDTQKDIDLISQAVVTNATLSATPRYFVRKDGSVNEEEFGDSTRPFVHVSGQLGQDTILPVTVPSMPGNVMDVLMSKIEEIKFVTGNTDVNNGSAPSGVTAASAIAALQETSGRSSKDANKAAYRAYAKLVTMVIERIRQFYDIPRQFRIVGADGSENFVDYSNAGLVPQPQGMEFGIDMGYRVPAFDLDIRAQRETAYTRAAQNELAIQMYQLGVFNPQMADQSVMLLDMMDFKGKDELKQKVQQMGTMMQVLQQIASIASQMAMATGDQQSAAMIQQIAAMAGGQAGLPQMGGGTFAMPEGDATGASIMPERHPFVEKAHANAEKATQPE